MIGGVVQADEARMGLTVRGRRGRTQPVEAIIASGYTGALTLPAALITLLGLRWQSTQRATLADGGICVFQVYVGKVVWDGKVRQILVDEANADPLDGMRLFRGYEWKMQVRYRGKVIIKRLGRR